MTSKLAYVSNEIDDLQEQNIIVALCFEKQLLVGSAIE
jgi:hypothetical protein